MKADEYRYWQSRPVQERMDAVSEMTLAAYAMKGMAPDVPRFQRIIVILQRPQRQISNCGRICGLLHTQPRFTKDLDLFIKADAVNAKATFTTLASFGAPLAGITVNDLANP